MAQSSTIFITASDARQNPMRETAVHDEARLIENAVLNAVKLGLYDCTVSDGTPMTMSSTQPTEVWTIDPSTSILYVPNHNLSTGDAVTLSSTGSLPSPLVSTSFYYAIYIDEDHIKLASSFANAVNGRPLAITIEAGVDSLTLTDNGSGYLQAPIVTFTGGNPNVAATATAYLADWGSVVAINNTTFGVGYTDLPTVQIVSQGTDGTAGSVTYKCVSATVSALGSNYRVGDLLSVISGTGTATTVRVTDIDPNGGAIALAIANPGNYSSLPVISGATTTASPGGGSGCTLNLTFGISSIAVALTGTGYVAPPRVTINSLTGSGATASATIYGGSLSEIIVTNPGYGYLDVSSIDLDTGSGATATVMLQPTSVGNIQLTNNGGYTYTDVPTVSIDANGSGASVDQVTMKVTSIQLISGGSNYQVGDSLLVAGGVASENAWIKVQSINSFGSIITYTLESGGLYTSLPGITNNPVVGGSGTLAAFNLRMGVESVTVNNGGNGYIAPPVVTVASPGGSGMTAQVRAVLTGGQVTQFIVEKSGYGYESIPSITITNGSGAVAEAYLSQTTVDYIDVSNPGSDYTTATVTISGGGAIVDATASANIVGGQVISINLLTPGSGYTSIPNVIITGDGSNATADAILTPTFISYIGLINGGSGYNVPPIVTIDGDATAVSLLTGTGVQNIVVDNIGDNYVSDPIIYLIPGQYQQYVPTSPVLVPTRAFGIARVALTSSGEGYQSTPSVTMSAPFFSVGTTATATATIGAGTGTFTIILYPTSRDYYAAWKGQSLSNSQLSRPYTERMDTIISYFTNLGYTINRLTNPYTNNTLMWSLQW